MPASIIEGIPDRRFIESFADHRYVLALASGGLWCDCVLALSGPYGLMRLLVATSDRFPAGTVLGTLVGYGIYVAVVCPAVIYALRTIWLEYLSEHWESLWPHARTTLGGSRDFVDQRELLQEALATKNSQLNEYVREHDTLRTAEFAMRNQYFAIGVLLAWNAVVGGETLSAAALSANSRTLFWTGLFAELTVAALMIVQGAKPLSISWARIYRDHTLWERHSSSVPPAGVA
ncbi:MAG: hypothetical protein ABI625_12705 [bacterium]